MTWIPTRLSEAARILLNFSLTAVLVHLLGGELVIQHKISVITKMAPKGPDYRLASICLNLALLEIILIHVSSLVKSFISPAITSLKKKGM